ncbi:(3S,6E)-nerolidol synthase 1 [Glycine soja]
MIGLYEASQLGIAGEDIVDEAGEFSGQFLCEKVDLIDNITMKLIRFLKRSGENGFNLLQWLYHGEISQICKWLAGLAFARELMTVKNQPLKWYNSSLACLMVELTKPISLVYITDNIFDIYGNLDELILFTAAISRKGQVSLTAPPSVCVKVKQRNTVVFYFKVRPQADDFTIFKGLDKYKNEELIKYGFLEDIW